MSKFTMEDLQRVMREAAGDDEQLKGEVLDSDFADLGYDSLALLEAAACIQRELGVKIGEEQISDVETPRAFIDLVNSQLEPAA
jgi:act minimal PKS acyl carrier protein